MRLPKMKKGRYTVSAIYTPGKGAKKYVTTARSKLVSFQVK